MGHTVAALAEAGLGGAGNETDGSAAGADNHRDVRIVEAVDINHVLQQRGEGALLLRDLAAISIHQRQLQGDERGELAGLQHVGDRSSREDRAPARA